VDSVFVPLLKTDLTPAQRRDTVRDVIVQATAVEDRLQLVAGELLYEVHRNTYWKEWTHTDADGLERGYKDLGEYVETELGMKRRKAEYLIAIYAKFCVELDLPLDLLRELEWTKARELVKVITPENAEELLAKVKGMKVLEVKEMVRAMKGKPATGGTEETTEQIILRLYPEQAEIFKAAVKIAEGMSGSEKIGNAVALIAADFVGSAAGSTPDAALVSLGVVVKGIERAYGVELEIKDVDKDRYADTGSDSGTDAAPSEDVDDIVPVGD